MTDAWSPRFRPVTHWDREFLREVFVSSWDRALAMAAVPEEVKAAVLAQQFEAQEYRYGFVAAKTDALKRVVKS